MYLNVMELVRAVLDLKNELCQLPPEGYVVVVKVRTREEPWTWGTEATQPIPGRTWEGLSFPVCPIRPIRARL